jgi:hypothetical protein
MLKLRIPGAMPPLPKILQGLEFRDKNITLILSRKVVVEWLTTLIRIREVSGSNLGRVVGYPEAFRGFHQSLHANATLVP